MTDPRSADLLGQIVEAAQLAQAYVAGQSIDEFRQDRRTQQAVTLNLLVIGEAAARFVQSFPDVAAQAPSVPWTAMRGMRNRIAHGYFSIDVDVVWRTATDALPALVASVEALLSTLKAQR